MGSYPGVRFFEELGQLYDYITQLEELDKALAKKAVSYYLTHDVELKNRIEQILRNKSCAVDGTTWDRHGVCEGYDYDIGERDMGVETQHDVSIEDECAHCGRKYKINGAVYEYPEGAFNYDTTEIEWEEEHKDN